jgi:STE24 endopeptidase
MALDQLNYLLIGVLTFGFLVPSILEYLQVSQPLSKVPATLAEYLSEAKLVEGKAYQRANFNFKLVTSSFTFVLTLLCVTQGWFGAIDTWVAALGYSPLVKSLLFFGLIFVVSDVLSLPFDYYSTFIIEEKFGFNKTSVRTFFSDKLKAYVLSLIVGGGLLLVFLWLIHSMGPDFWWQFWLVAVVFMVLINVGYTAWILPLFNRLTPLDEGDLRNKLLEYAAKVNFPVKHIFVMDVLYDTLLEQHPPEELVAVLAHEIGHYKKNHLKWGMLISVLQVGFLLFLLGQVVFSEAMSLALGASSWSVHLNILGFTMLFAPLSMVLGIGMNWLSRRHEFEADQYAKETYGGKPLAEALKTLSVKTLSTIHPHPWYVFVNYSHPPLLQRLQRLEG